MHKKAASITLLTLLILLAVITKVQNGCAVSWSVQTNRLTTDTAFDGLPAVIEMDDGKIWIVWARDCLGNYTLYYTTSPDSGKSWSNEENITQHALPHNTNPSITQLMNGTIMVVWQSNRPPPKPLEPDFSLNVNPKNLTIPQDSSHNSTIIVTSIRNFNDPVILRVLSQPEGVSSTLNPETVTPPPNGTANSTLTVSVNPTATPGNYTVAILGTSGKLKHTVTIDLEITQPGGGSGAGIDLKLSSISFSTAEEEESELIEDYEIFYKTSNDNGGNWSKDIKITDNTYADVGPSIVQLINGTIMVVWESSGAGSRDIVYASTLDGASWTHGNVTINPGLDKSPSIIQTKDERIWVAWSSNRTGDNEIFYKIYDGSTWSGAIRRTYSMNSDTCPSILQTQDEKIWIFWLSYEDSPTATGEIYYEYSSNNGETWSGSTPFTTNNYEDVLPATAQTHDTKIWVVWTSDKDGNWEIYYRTSLAGDVNGDGSVDILDLSRVEQAYGHPKNEPEYDPEADLNADGVVDVFELAVIGKNYGET